MPVKRGRFRRSRFREKAPRAHGYHHEMFHHDEHVGMQCHELGELVDAGTLSSRTAVLPLQGVRSVPIHCGEL
jgi:hypothetical protein